MTLRGCEHLKSIKLGGDKAADVVVERGSLDRIEEYLDLERRTLVLTDREVPQKYVDKVCLKSRYPVRVSVWPGEQINSVENYQRLCEAMLDNSFGEGDCIVAVGGERILALGGFLAATYKGGIDHYCIPTTLSSQMGNGFFGKSYVSVGKCANALGALKSPKRVLIDPQALDTLNERQMANGFADAIRLALTLDKKLFEYLENEDVEKDKTIDYIITRALEVKKYVYCTEGVPSSLADALTLGDIIAESMTKTQFSYGERLAIGMLPMCSGEVRIRLRSLLSKVGLPVVWQYDVERLFRDSLRGKETEKIPLVMCDEVGRCKRDVLSVPEYHKIIKTVYGG